MLIFSHWDLFYRLSFVFSSLCRRFGRSRSYFTRCFLLKPVIEVSFMPCWEFFASEILLLERMRLDGSITVEVNKVLLDGNDSFFCFDISSWHSFARESRPSSILFHIVVKLSIVYYLYSDGILLDATFASLTSASRSLSGFSQNLIVTHLMYNNECIPYYAHIWHQMFKLASKTEGCIQVKGVNPLSYLWWFIASTSFP